MLATIEVPAVQRAPREQLASDAPPMLSPLVDCTAAAPADWFAVETVNRFEKALAWKMLEEGIVYYLPLVQRVTRVAHFKRTQVLPLFPNYLFVADGPLSAATAFCRETRGVLNVIRAGDQRRLRRELSSLEIALFANPKLEVCDIETVGQRCRVLWGALEGFEGTVEGFHEGKGMVRVYLRIEILGRTISLDVDRTDLELL